MSHFLCVFSALILTFWITTTNAGSFSAHLYRNDMGLISSDEGVYLEPTERSHVELNLRHKTHTPGLHRERHVIKFEFRTTEDNGLLVYGRARGGPEDILALKLAGGKLYYTVRCPSLSADLLFRHPMGKLSDGHWHSVAVRFRRDNMRMQVVVDRVRDTKAYATNCAELTSLVFGGVTPRDSQLLSGILGNVPHYSGCIRRVHIPRSLRVAASYYTVSTCPA
ncbi:hypothetical protein V1264_000736 [Littorina saxatilis]|uniref:Laminin G domain-containing protein n=2 Tax=Littorina saxatilis TaxID=31220 RepID=A0AAN9C0Z8_9CAEN